MTFPASLILNPRCAVAILVLLVSLDDVAESNNGFNLDDALVSPREIIGGGRPWDGIRSLDYPAFVSADEAGFLKSKDRVLGVELNGVARAYPIRILNDHEIVDHAFAGSAVVVTYCPLCNSGVAINAKIDNTRLELGVSD